eukprot:6548706-Pyramimonas_sp.AAC.2
MFQVRARHLLDGCVAAAVMGRERAKIAARRASGSGSPMRAFVVWINGRTRGRASLRPLGELELGAS